MKLMLKVFRRLVIAFSLIASAARAAQTWQVEELTLTASAAPSILPIDVAVTAEFTAPGGQTIRVRGFWDGERTWRVRFTPTTPGRWRYRIAAEPALAGLARDGSLEVTAAPRATRGFLRRNPEFPQSFRFDGSGEPFFVWGNTSYHIVATAQTDAPWRAALASMRAAGLNKVRFHVGSIPIFEKAGPHPASPAFLDHDTARPNLSHWRAADEVIRACAELGLLADLIVYPYIRTGDDDSTVRDDRFRRYVIARYAAFPHVMWCLTNEWNYSRYPREFWTDLGQRFAAEDPWTLDPTARDTRAPRALTIHQQTRPDWNFPADTWPSHANIQLGVRNRGTTARVGDEWKQAAAKPGAVFRFGDDWGNHSIVRNWNGRHPIVNDEYGYIGEPQDNSEPRRPDGSFASYSREKHRRTAWAIAVGGGYGAAGDKRDFPTGRPYYSGLWQPAPDYEDLTRLIAFFTRGDIPFWRMRPANDLVAGAARTYALADAGRCYVIYAAAGGRFSLRLPPGDFRATRLDPRTGEESTVPLRRAAGSAAVEFEAPVGDDWVFRVVAP
jgi:hypothetical protein